MHTRIHLFLFRLSPLVIVFLLSAGCKGTFSPQTQLGPAPAPPRHPRMC